MASGCSSACASRSQTANALAARAETLRAARKDAGVDVKWVAPANYHVTLKFLGWTRDDAIGAVRDALGAGARRRRARSSSARARLGAFPSLDKASVLWAGVETAAALDDARGARRGARWPGSASRPRRGRFTRT